MRRFLESSSSTCRPGAGRVAFLSALLVSLVFGAPTGAAAPQTGTVPFPLSDSDLSALMADRAARTDSLTIVGYPAPKRTWGSNWTLASQEWSWSVEAPVAGPYECTLLVSGPTGTALEVSSDLGASFLSLAEQGWQRATFAAPLYLPAGTSTIRLHLSQDAPSVLDLFALEVAPTQVAGEVRARAFQTRSKDDWLQRARYGLGVTWGEWAYPPTGPKKPWPAQVDDFDAAAFVAAVADTGADYLVLSTTWATYYVAAPIAAVDAILPGRTSARDLIGEIASGLHARGIRLILYYHCGHGDSAWWGLQGFDPDDKASFVTNWESIVTEIGERYGQLLDGWWFDDGVVYYPAPFERVTAAARAGNAHRLVTYNNFTFPRFTEFQDLAAGENFSSMRYDDGTLISLDGDGLYAGGECLGMIPHGWFVYDGPGWAVSGPGVVVAPTAWNAAQTEATIRTYMPRTFTLNVLAYEDGSFGSNTRSTLAAVREAFAPPSVATEVTRWVLPPDAGALTDVGLDVTLSDARDAAASIACTIAVHASSAPSGPGGAYAPPESLSLSGEVPPPGGRSYLIGLRATDSDGNPGRGACSVVVPAVLTPSHITRLLWEAVEAEAAFVREGDAPPSHGAVVLPEEALR